MTRLFLLSGMPGAGKSTLARRLAARHDAVLLSPDDWFSATGLDPHDAPLRRRFERRLWSHAQDLLARGVSVVVDYGSWARLERERIRKAARALGVEVELHALDVPLAERWRRLELRNAQDGSVPITREQLESWQVFWQPPRPDELAAYDAPLD
jgi:predicted kinase